MILVTSGWADRDYHFSPHESRRLHQGQVGKDHRNEGSRTTGSEEQRSRHTGSRRFRQSAGLAHEEPAARRGCRWPGSSGRENGHAVQARRGRVRHLAKAPLPNTRVLPKTRLVSKPESVSFDQAACCADCGAYRLAGASRQRTPSAGAEGPDQRRGGRDRHLLPCRSRSHLGLT